MQSIPDRLSWWDDPGGWLRFLFDRFFPNLAKPDIAGLFIEHLTRWHPSLCRREKGSTNEVTNETLREANCRVIKWLFQKVPEELIEAGFLSPSWSSEKEALDFILHRCCAWHDKEFVPAWPSIKTLIIDKGDSPLVSRQAWMAHLFFNLDFIEDPKATKSWNKSLDVAFQQVEGRLPSKEEREELWNALYVHAHEKHDPTILKVNRRGKTHLRPEKLRDLAFELGMTSSKKVKSVDVDGKKRWIRRRPVLFGSNLNENKKIIRGKQELSAVHEAENLESARAIQSFRESYREPAGARGALGCLDGTYSSRKVAGLENGVSVKVIERWEKKIRVDAKRLGLDRFLVPRH